MDGKYLVTLYLFIAMVVVLYGKHNRPQNYDTNYLKYRRAVGEYS